MGRPPEPAVIGVSEAAVWDQRYRDGRDGWELGCAAPPLEAFLRRGVRAPQPPGQVLVPGCGRGHEAALLAHLGFEAIGLDFSAEALAEARRLHGTDRQQLRWLQADLLDAPALAAAGVAAASLAGVLEHTCFCAIDPLHRDRYLEQVHRLLRPGGWLLGLFWCHRREGGPPFGSDPEQLAAQLRSHGFAPAVWDPAAGSVEARKDEWLGLWSKQP